MIQKQDIHKIIEPILEEKKAFLVDLKISKDNRIAVYIDSMDGITIDDCVEVSRRIEKSLDRDQEDFELEVSTPGLTSEFKVPEQYKKYLNKELQVLAKDGKKYQGTLLNISDRGIEIEVEKQVKKEGKKKKETVRENLNIDFSMINATKPKLSF